MTLIELKSYFVDLAKSDPELLHKDNDPALFFRSPKDAAGAICNRGEKISVLMAPYDKHPKVTTGENHVWMKQGFLLILGQVRPDDYDHQLEVQSRCELVADRFFNQMYYDRVSPKLYGFDINSWNCEAVGPVVDNHYGYAIVFDIKDAIVLTRP